MTAQKHIKMIMTDKSIKSGKLAEMVGLEKQAMYNALFRKTMQYAEASRIADALGCDIIWRDRETGKEY